MPLRICFVTAEMAPLAKAGGLADVSAALFKYLTAAGHDMRLFLPAYSSIDRKGIDIQPVEFMRHMLVKIGAQDFPYSVLTASLPGSSARFFLIDCPACFARSGIYTSEADEHRRFLLLTHAAFMSCQRMGFARLLVLPFFLFTGVLEKRIRRLTQECAAGHPDTEFLCAHYLDVHPLLVEAFTERSEEAIHGSPNMNCGLCKYRVRLPGFEAAVGQPQVGHHHHVRGIGQDGNAPAAPHHAHDHTHDHGQAHQH